MGRWTKRVGHSRRKITPSKFARLLQLGELVTHEFRCSPESVVTLELFPYIADTIANAHTSMVSLLATLKVVTYREKYYWMNPRTGECWVLSDTGIDVWADRRNSRCWWVILAERLYWEHLLKTTSQLNRRKYDWRVGNFSGRDTVKKDLELTYDMESFLTWLSGLSINHSILGNDVDKLIRYCALKEIKTHHSHKFNSYLYLKEIQL